MKQRLHGFTLVELSIVLVIIGLVIGGVLAGRDLIEAATIRSEIRRFGEWGAAVNAYRLKYNALAGDDANAATLGLGVSGDGDGLIELTYSLPLEGLNAWGHLAKAGLVPGAYPGDDTCVTGESFPATLLRSSNPYAASLSFPGSGYAIFTAYLVGEDTFNGDYTFLGDNKIWIANIGCSPAHFFGLSRGGTSSATLWRLDMKLDDGIPFTGSVRLMGQDGIADLNSLHAMCNGTGIVGGNCNYQIPGSPFCATGTRTQGTYLDDNSNVCPLAYRLF